MNHLIQARALFGRCKAWASHGTRGVGGNRPRGAVPEAGYLALGELEVLGEIHADELGGEVQHERRIELAAVHRPAGIFEITGEVERKNIDGEHAGLAGAERGESFLMGIVSVRGKNNESGHATLLP